MPVRLINDKMYKMKMLRDKSERTAQVKDYLDHHPIAQI